ncbi:TPA: hypothetical protein ACH3X1_006261 [Trebouxia sp. C0004]
MQKVAQDQLVLPATSYMWQKSCRSFAEHVFGHTESLFTDVFSGHVFFRTCAFRILHQQVGQQHHGSLPRRCQTLPANATTYDMYAMHQEPQKQQPRQPPDASTLQQANIAITLRAVASQNYSKATDVYSIGSVLWELMTWQIPWDDHNPSQAAHQRRLGMSIHGLTCFSCQVIRFVDMQALRLQLQCLQLQEEQCTANAHVQSQSETLLVPYQALGRS